MSLIESPSFTHINQTLHETSLAGENYVLSLAQIVNFYAASASSPSNQIHLFDRATLQSTDVLKGHKEGTTQLRTISGLGPSTREMLLSSGKDGRVIAWDERSGSASIEMEGSGRLRPLLCCDASEDGLLVAAGTDLQKEDAFIIYWDPRNPVAQLRSHGSTHSDDITAVHFLKGEHTSSSDRVLLSASSDGLISISNALEADEDEAVTHVGNWGCSVSQGGWISNARIWAASDMETFSCWSSELDRLLDVDIRSPSLHDHQHTWVTDYLIKGHATRKVNSGLGVFVGSNELSVFPLIANSISSSHLVRGDVALITSGDLSNGMVPWTIHSVWTGGHSGIVRSLHWDEEHGVLVTGGEDSKINTWRIQDLGTADVSIPDQQDEHMELDPSNLKREWNDTKDDDHAWLHFRVENDPGGSERSFIDQVTLDYMR